MGYAEQKGKKHRLSWLLCLLVIGECVFSVRGGAEKDMWKSSLEKEEDSRMPLKITFDKPARNWTDGVPIGNGRLGAMIWGGVASETINLNEDTLWTGVPKEYTNSSARKVLADVRKLVDDGKFAEATEAAVDLSGEPSDVYQLLGDIKIEFDDSHQNYTSGTYHRELDLDTATASVKYSVGEVEYTREHFASNPDQVIVTKISGSKPGSLSFSVFLDSKLPHHLEVTSNNRIIMKGSCRSNRISPKLNPDGSRRILLEKRNLNEDPKGIQFGAIMDIQISDGRGTIKVLDGKKIVVEGSDWAVLRLVASSSFAGPFTEPSESPRNPMSDSLKYLESIKELPYSDLYSHHLDDYQNLFRRVSLQLFKSSNSKSPVNNSYSKEINENAVSTANRVKSFKSDEDPSLVELLFQYGRYLLISSSRPGTQVANLQGIWNKDVEPAWDGAPHLNINLQMNYWPSLPGNLKECQEPLFDYISSLSKTGSKTAKVNYGASGWVAHQVSDIWAKSSPDRGQAVWALWPMGGAWLCTHLWEQYTYTMDKDFLRNTAYPLLEGCTSFLLDWLVEGKGGHLETNPSTSPEHMFIAPDGKQASVSYSASMDVEIIGEVFSEIISAAQILGRSEDDLIKRVIQTQSKLLPPRIAADGSIMEWAEDFKDPEVHHRHISHLFGLFPGHTINLEKTPELCKAAEKTLIKRGDEGPGWSTTWKAACWARLHNAEHAYQVIKQLIILVDPDHESNYEGGLYSNLFTAHPPFQIDANFGFSAAVAEMLVQSTMEDLYFLPALPQNKWPNGCVKGLKARGGLTVNICWKDGDLHEAGLWSMEHTTFKRLHYRENTVMTNLSSGLVYTFDRQLNFVDKYPLDNFFN